MISLPKIGLSGRYKLTVLREDKTEKTTTGWFKNLITDNGLNDIATQTPVTLRSSGGIAYSVCVGSGNATPLVTDVALQNFIAVKNSPSADITINTTDRYLSALYEWEFAVGAAEGNISEIGVGKTQTDLFSRALVVDSGGSPTTITVLSDEILRVEYELRVNQPTGDFTSTVDGYDLTIRAANANTIQGPGSPNSAGWGDFKFSFTSRAGNNGHAITTGAIQPITSIPGGLTVFPSGYVVDDSYIEDSFYRTAQISIPTTSSNQNNKTLIFSCGPGSWQCEFDPVIAKDETQVLSFGVKMQWAREGELPS